MSRELKCRFQVYCVESTPRAVIEACEAIEGVFVVDGRFEVDYWSSDSAVKVVAEGYCSGGRLPELKEFFQKIAMLPSVNSVVVEYDQNGEEYGDWTFEGSTPYS